MNKEIDNKTIEEETKRFLNSLFISIEGESVTFDLVFDRRCKYLKRLWIVYDEQTFISNEIKKIKNAIEDLEQYSEYPESLIYNRFYNASKGYILYLERKLSSLQNEIVETPDTLKKSPGRPAKQTYPFTYFLSCSEEDKKKVIDVMKEQFKANGQPGIIKTCIALNHKDYFKWPTPRNEFWGALSSLLGEKFTDSNLNAHRKKMIDSAEFNPLKKEIEDIKGKLP